MVALAAHLQRERNIKVLVCCPEGNESLCALLGARPRLRQHLAARRHGRRRWLLTRARKTSPLGPRPIHRPPGGHRPGPSASGGQSADYIHLLIITLPTRQQGSSGQRCRTVTGTTSLRCDATCTFMYHSLRRLGSRTNTPDHSFMPNMWRKRKARAGGGRSDQPVLLGLTHLSRTIAKFLLFVPVRGLGFGFGILGFGV